jgi:hypothetical protein
MKYLHKQKGVIILIVFLIMGLMLILGCYFISFSLTETRISKSQEASAKTYYLAEAGINEAVWKLKNDHTTADGDPAWADDFIDEAKNPYPGGGYWNTGFIHFFAGGSYAISIQNTARGKGDIVAIANMPLSGGKTSQRIVKTAVFKALASPIANSGIFTGGSSENIDINFSYIRVNNGNLFCNNNLNISWLSNIDINDNPETEDILEGQILVANNFINNLSTVSSTAICAKNSCTESCPDYMPGKTSCPPNSVSVPIVNFDNPDADSFKSRAQAAQDLSQCQVLCNGSPCSTNCVFTSGQFSDLLWNIGQGGTLTLNNEITYVTGTIDLKGGKTLIINGALVADDNIYIGQSLTWTKGGTKHTGFSQITVNRPSDQSPSGILAKRKINFDIYSSFAPISITGVIYSNDEIRINSVPQSFDVIGGLIGRKLSFSSLWQWFNVTMDNDIILYGLGYKINDMIINPTYSPVIVIDHWEESY